MPFCFSRNTLAVVIAAIASLGIPSALNAQDGASAFKSNCVLCHGPNGSSSTPTGKALGAKDLRSKEIQGKSDGDLADVISKGNGKMPAFGAKLSGGTIQSLVGYIRQLPGH